MCDATDVVDVEKDCRAEDCYSDCDCDTDNRDCDPTVMMEVGESPSIKVTGMFCSEI